MKKLYIAPDMELFKVSLRDVVLASPIEGTIPIEGDLDPTEPATDGELDF